MKFVILSALVVMQGTFAAANEIKTLYFNFQAEREAAENCKMASFSGRPEAFEIEMKEVPSANKNRYFIGVGQAKRELSGQVLSVSIDLLETRSPSNESVFLSVLHLKTNGSKKGQQDVSTRTRDLTKLNLIASDVPMLGSDNCVYLQTFALMGGI